MSYFVRHREHKAQIIFGLETCYIQQRHRVDSKNYNHRYLSVSNLYFYSQQLTLQIPQIY